MSRGSPGWAHAVAALLLVGNASCREEEEVIIPIPRPPTAIEAVTATVASPSAHSDAIEPPNAATEGRAGCPEAPPWIAAEACEADGVLYATGSAPRGMNRSLARLAAADRARLALGVAANRGKPPRTFVLRGVEVLELASCASDVHALARMPAPKGSGAPACPPNLVDGQLRVELAECPSWIQRLAWKEGEHMVGVGVVDRVRNVGLAERTALHRALANAGKVREVGMTLGGDSLNTASEVKGVVEVSRELARCDGALYAKVVARPVP